MASSFQYFLKFILQCKLLLPVKEWVVKQWDGDGSWHGGEKCAGEMRSWSFLRHRTVCIVDIVSATIFSDYSCLGDVLSLFYAQYLH